MSVSAHRAGVPPSSDLLTSVLSFLRTSTPTNSSALAGAPASTTAPEPAKNANKSSRGGIEECALVYADGDDLRIVGGQKIGYPSRRRIQFGWAHPPNKRPFVGIRLLFQRADARGNETRRRFGCVFLYQSDLSLRLCLGNQIGPWLASMVVLANSDPASRLQTESSTDGAPVRYLPTYLGRCT